MTAPTTTPSDRGFWEALARLHGHRCPMSILGARLGLTARAALGEPGAGTHLAARYLHRTCALDGIQLATSCTLGNNNLEVDGAGRHVLTLRVQETGLEVTAELTESALAEGKRYGDLRRRVQALPDGSPEAAALQDEMELLLRSLECAPDEAVVSLPAGGG